MTDAAAASRWLILADDLTGACDCAVAFAGRGRPASVVWQRVPPQVPILAVDMDSRRLAAAPARAAMRARLATLPLGGRQIYKKIDSTWRGQPAAEIAALLRGLWERGTDALALVAPAFPATGRTMRDGRVFLDGAPLEESVLWQRDHSYADADAARILEDEGLRVARLARGAAAATQPLAGAEVLLCDAEVPEDLDRIAAIGQAIDRPVLWVGSGGLAASLAKAQAGTFEADATPMPGPGGCLFVVGSAAGASRSAAAVLAADPDVLRVELGYADLHGASARARGQAIADRLRQGLDVLVTISEEKAPDFTLGSAIVAGLADLLVPACLACGALFVTGGETARALLTAVGVTAIRLFGEIAPGVPWGETEGALRLPVITKAGGFGDAHTLRRCLAHFRSLPRQETVR